MDLLRALFSAPRPPRVSSLAELRAHVLAYVTEPDTITRAVLSGLAGDRVGFAFAGGYQAALTKLVPALPKDGLLACLCATEEGGGHPRAIKTRLEGSSLTGKKTFVTLGTEADRLLVVATRGEGDAGRPRLVVVCVPKDRAGVTLRERTPTPVVPEIPHAEVTFDHCEVSPSDVLEGDGYDAYLKPFRTIEDAHVMASIISYLASRALDGGWARPWIEDAAALLLTLRAIMQEPPSRAETHIALAGALRTVHALVRTAELTKLDDETRARFERDRGILLIAGSVREKRREAAWTAIAR